MNPSSGHHQEQEIRHLYQALLDSWNRQDARAFAALFADDGNTIGFDGSLMQGSEHIAQELSRIFSSHKVSRYVSIIREVRRVSPSVCLLRANAGMVPPGKAEINPKVNVVQTLLAQEQAGQLRIILYQNTPAALHERQDLSEQLTRELQAVLDQSTGI